MNFAHLVLNEDSENPLYLQLADKLRQIINMGDVTDGERLPSIRRISHAMQVNPATVVAAYRILEKEGWVRSRPGSGVYACRKPQQAGTDLSESMLWANLSYHHVNEQNYIDMAAGTPSPDMFPVAPFKSILNEVLDRDAGWAFEYQKIAGWEPFRKTLSTYAEEILQISVDPSHIWVVSGAQQGIDLTAKALLHPGDRVIVEAPTYRGALAAFWSRGADTIALKLGEDGMDMLELEKRIRQTSPRLLYIQSRFQTPTTFSWGQTKLQTLLDLADRYNFYILEDDLLSDLYFFSKPEPLNLKSIDHTDQVLYIRGFSKVLLPGLRLGMLIIPDSLQPLYEQAKQSTDIATDGFLQRAVDLYLQQEHHKSRMDELRMYYGTLYSKILQESKQYLEPLGSSIYACQGGLHLWVQLPSGISSSQLLTEALREGLRFMPGEAFNDKEHIRISFACLSSDKASEGISRLATLLSKLR